MKSLKLSKIFSVLLIFALLLFVNPPSSASTAPLFISPYSWTSLSSGTDRSVYSLAVDGSQNLYAGGFFALAGGISADYIAKWNGTTWSTLGSDHLNGAVLGLAVDSSGNNLYAGGQFTTIGSTTFNRVAKWNGSSWSTLADGLSGIAGASGSVEDLILDSSNNVYIGGGFSSAGGGPANNIAKWDGSNWSALGSGMDDNVASMVYDNTNNRLYAAGYFHNAGGTPANHVAQWNGTTWSALGDGTNDVIYSLALDGSGNLYAGGVFTTAGGNPANHIAKWNGSTWSNLGDGANGYVLTVAVDGSGNLFAGGPFSMIGGVSASRIAKWNGSSWSALGSGTYGASWYLKPSGANLYAGGDFTAAGGTNASHIAKWGPDTTAPLVSVSSPANGATIQPTNTLLVTFSEDMKHDGSTGAADYTRNYRLVEAKGDGFQAAFCADDVGDQDLDISIESAVYNNHGGSGPFEVTLGINGGVALPNGSYRLFICGATSVEDLAGNAINGGASDSLVNFTVFKQAGTVLPQTGFAPGAITHLPPQPLSKAYQDLGAIRLEIPSLGIDAPIIGVPISKDGWDLTWLGNQVGWLEGTTFPSWSGNSALTAHVVDINGQPGLFVDLGKLSYGKEISVHAWGQKYIYQVRSVKTSVKPNDVSIFKHQTYPYLTLITCKGYDEAKDIYLWRVVVQAVQVRVE